MLLHVIYSNIMIGANLVTRCNNGFLEHGYFITYATFSFSAGNDYVINTFPDARDPET
jgi:hypothetical protein